jgi:hypothetical protein
VTPDGGEGLFVASGSCSNGTGTAPSQDDGGSLIVDSYTGGPSHTGTCWYRQNINGDLRQFGATLGSSYDCKHGNILSSGPTPCITVDDTSSPPAILLNAEAAAEGAGVHRLTTSGVQLYLSKPFSLDADMTLDGGVGSPDISNHNIDSPGTIWVTAATTPTPTPAVALGANSALQNISVMPKWLGETLYNNGSSATLPNQQAILAAMISGTTGGWTGVACTSTCAIRNANVVGFDTAIDVSSGGQVRVSLKSGTGYPLR